jgi:hypothetical protein
MSDINSPNTYLSDDEWMELKALKNQINQNPAAVVPEKMELFTGLLVRSWNEKLKSS